MLSHTTHQKELFCPFEIEHSWRTALGDELYEPYLSELAAFIARERAGNIPIYPPAELVFNAFLTTPFDSVKVVIIGQDPYHGVGQAHGLSFSVPNGVPPPPSLQNIFKELHTDLDLPIPTHGSLIKWAEQGVMLLNASLTVRQGEPMSHAGKGWERFTDAVVRVLAKRAEPVIFVLWGKFAQEKCAHIEGLSGNGRHLILSAPHPSPFSVHKGFFGCRHFSQINESLRMSGLAPIDWGL